VYKPTGKLHAGMLEPLAFSDPAIVDMVANLKWLPSASNFGTNFHVFQNNEVQLMSCYRPSTVKVNCHAASSAI